MLNVVENELLTPWICQIARFSMLFVGREMSRIGFEPGQFFFLTELYKNEGLSQDELSLRVGVDKSNTSRALAKLEKYGFIRREADPQNHRVKKVYLEPKAREVRKQLIKIQHKWNRELLNGVSKATRAKLLANLKVMATNAEIYFREQNKPSLKQAWYG